MAAENDQINVARLLLERGANIEARNKSGETALISASHNHTSWRDSIANKPALIKLLLEKKANLEARDYSGNTALLAGTCFNADNSERKASKLAAVKVLLEKGASIDSKNKDGLSALTCPNRTNPPEVAALFEQALQLRKQLEQIESRKPAERFADYLSAFEKNPRDEFLREKILHAATALPEPPAIPDAARELFVLASNQIRQATTPATLDQPIILLRKVLDLAPWWGNAYFNYSRALELRGQYSDAIQQLKYYLELKPSEADARDARSHLIVIQTEEEAIAQKPQ